MGKVRRQMTRFQGVHSHCSNSNTCQRPPLVSVHWIGIGFVGFDSTFRGFGVSNNYGSNKSMRYASIRHHWARTPEVAKAVLVCCTARASLALMFCHLTPIPGIRLVRSKPSSHQLLSYLENLLPCQIHQSAYP